MSPLSFRGELRQRAPDITHQEAEAFVNEIAHSAECLNVRCDALILAVLSHESGRRRVTQFTRWRSSCHVLGLSLTLCLSAGCASPQNVSLCAARAVTAKKAKGKTLSEVETV